MSFKHDPKRIDRVLSNRVQKLLSANRDSILPIIQVGDPVLRTACKQYSGGLSPETLRKLIFAMKTTMRKAPGVGLAAPQIGLDTAIAVIEDTSVEEGAQNPDDLRETSHIPFYVIINPRYVVLEKDEEITKNFFEGCLSFANHYALRKRAYRIQAFWTDEKGRDFEEELTGWHARIFQHETDHLSGEIYIDKSEIRSLSTAQNLEDFGWDDNIENAAKILDFNL